ncbi:MAG: STAS domain-containing protein [Planctomycetaceae bacterium]|nr:STAS domain-containing protein [Planctomycetaceae bacterium]
MSQTCEPREARIYRFESCMDTVACERIEPELQASLAEGEASVVFDLAGVKFVSSAFLGLCVRAYQKTCQFGFEMINVEPTIKRVFKIAGLEDMLKVR